MRIHFLTGKRGGFGAMVPTLEALQEFAEVQIIEGYEHGEYDALEGWHASYLLIPGCAVDVSPNASREELLAVCAHDLAEEWGACRRDYDEDFEWDEIPLGYPDILLLLGDRGESLFAAAVAHQAGDILIAHVEGGDVTGCLDDSCRHAISQLAHVHFCTGEEQKNRLIAMGQAPERVHVVGDVHIDRLMRELEKPLKPLEWAKDAVIVLYHPDTLHPERIEPEFQGILDATRGEKRVFIRPCSDLGHEKINRMIDATGETVFPNIPHSEFIMGARQAKMIIGNSSFGVKEAPYIGLKAVNIGDRQNGRPQGKFYGDGKAYERIAAVLRGVDKGLLDKRWAA